MTDAIVFSAGSSTGLLLHGGPALFARDKSLTAAHLKGIAKALKSSRLELDEMRLNGHRICRYP